jgi:hypothetical protein
MFVKWKTNTLFSSFLDNLFHFAQNFLSILFKGPTFSPFFFFFFLSFLSSHFFKRRRENVELHNKSNHVDQHHKSRNNKQLNLGIQQGMLFQFKRCGWAKVSTAQPKQLDNIGRHPSKKIHNEKRPRRSVVRNDDNHGTEGSSKSKRAVNEGKQFLVEKALNQEEQQDEKAEADHDSLGNAQGREHDARVLKGKERAKAHGQRNDAQHGFDPAKETVAAGIEDPVVGVKEGGARRAGAQIFAARVAKARAGTMRRAAGGAAGAAVRQLGAHQRLVAAAAALAAEHRPRLCRRRRAPRPRRARTLRRLLARAALPRTLWRSGRSCSSPAK